MEETIGKNIFVLQIIAFGSGAANSQNPEEDPCHRQSMC